VPPTKAPLVVRPTGSIFTVFLFLKASPFVFYMFGWLLVPWTTFQWGFTISSIAADLWFRKNVAGRLILGMRWSSRVTDGSETQWLFEYIEGGVHNRDAAPHVLAAAWGRFGTSSRSLGSASGRCS
jgi:hypothetical protein